MTQINTKPEWEKTEKIIELLEKIISPDAKVEHNVYLPVIGSPSGRKRQCDIVIKFGSEPRQSITIVEVQKRKKMPDINTFQGWLRKMSEVGAQQLICVSALGYPKSIIEDVAINIGPTVTLMTLKELEGKNPKDFPPFLIKLTPQFEIFQFSSMELDVPNEVEVNSEIAVDSSYKILSVENNPESYSIDEFVINILNNSQGSFNYYNINLPDEYEAEIEINKSELSLLLKLDRINVKLNDNNRSSIWLNYKNKKYKIAKWSIKLNIKKNNLKVNHLKYQQELKNGTLAWIATCQIQINDYLKEIQFIFKPDKDGLLKLVVGNFQLSI